MAERKGYQRLERQGASISSASATACGASGSVLPLEIKVGGKVRVTLPVTDISLNRSSARKFFTPEYAQPALLLETIHDYRLDSPQTDRDAGKKEHRQQLICFSECAVSPIARASVRVGSNHCHLARDMRSSRIASENDLGGVQLEIGGVPDDKSERRVYLIDGLGIGCSITPRIFDGDHRVTVSCQDFHVVGDAMFVSGYESATVHPDDCWTRRVCFLLIVQIKRFIFPAAIGDVAPRNDATWNMLFESGLGSPGAPGERVRNKCNRWPRAESEGQYAN